jgi:hypothetical protein
MVHIIVLNVHAPTEDNTDDRKDSFYKELQRIFDKFPKYHINKKNGVFWDVMLCGSCKNWRFGGI